MGKYATKMIEDITKLATVDIPCAIDNGCTLHDYNKYRATLNLTIVQAIFGAEYTERNSKKNGMTYKVKLNHSIADRSEINIITNLMNDFVGNVELPFMNELNSSNDEEDMDIPIIDTDLPKLDKISAKSISEYLFGINGIINMRFSGLDIVELSAVAERVKKANRRKNMIIVGSAILVGAGVGAGIAMYKKSKNNDSDYIDDIDDPTQLMDGDDPIELMGNDDPIDDIPNVSID